MATKSKDSIGSSNNCGIKREKVALTTSNSKPKNKPTTTTSSSTLKPSSSSDKPLPNYLKHTKSSLHDNSGPGPGPKPALIRRRSFDNKAPRAQTKPVSERLAQQHPTRSSSFSRVPRGAVGPTPRPLYSNAPKKGSGEAFVRKEAPSPDQVVNFKVDAKEAQEEEEEEEDKQEFDHVMHDNITTVSEKLVAVISDNGDHRDNGVGVEEERDHHHGNKSEDQESRDCGTDENGKEGISVVGSEDAISVAEESIKEDEKEVRDDEEINNDHDHGSLGEIESKTSAVNESFIGYERVADINVVVDDDGGAGVEEGAKKRKEEGELGKKSEEEGKKGISSENNKNKGKKEAQVAYNDVIEETASKLLEKRKNKVKALVGAFETVIDYETAANNK